MADFEDALAPTWKNLLQGQLNLLSANKGTLSVTKDGKETKLNQKVAALKIRPRGWHLEEYNFVVDGEAVSASIFDFAVYFFHNHKIRQENGMGGVFYYLAKLESYKEAELWSQIFKGISFIRTYHNLQQTCRRLVRRRLLRILSLVANPFPSRY